MKSKKAFLLFGFLVFVALLLVFLPRPSCCGEDPESQLHDQLIAKAVAGDVQAAKELYVEYSQYGRSNEALMWAHFGALNGSLYLIDEYVKIYVGLTPEQQEVQMQLIDLGKEKKGYEVLKKKLEARKEER